MSKLVDQHDIEAALRPLDSQDLTELHDWQDNEVPVGKLALSSPASATRSISLTDPDSRLSSIYPIAVSSALLTSRAISRLFDNASIDKVVLHNGRLVPDEVTKYIADSRQIPWYTFETGSVINTIRIAKKQTIYNHEFFRESWEQFSSSHLSHAQLAEVDAYLGLRRGDSATLGIHTYSPGESTRDELIKTLRISGEGKIISFFTSSIDEFQLIYPSASYIWEPIYTDQFEALTALIQWASKNPEYTLVVRIHPNEGSKRNHLGMNGVKSLDGYRQALDSHQNISNLRVIWPDEDLSSHTIADCSDVCVVWRSTIGIEIAARGKPVVLLDDSAYRTAGFCHTLKNAADLSRAIDFALNSTADDREGKSRLARSWMYHQDIRLSIPFPLIRDHGKMERVSLEITDPKQLTRANWDCLDRIGGFLIEDNWPYS